MTFTYLMHIIHLLDRAQSDIRFVVQMETDSLSPTSSSFCITSRMSGDVLSNKCFIMPKALNNHERVSLLRPNVSSFNKQIFSTNLFVIFVCVMGLT